MTKETHLPKGGEFKRRSPAVDYPHLSFLPQQARPSKTMHKGMRQGSVETVPVSGSNPIASMPKDHRPKPTYLARVLPGWAQWNVLKAIRHSFLAWMATILILLSACSSTPTATPAPSPGVRASSPAATASQTVSNDPCAVQGQTPPGGNIAAHFATALAFAPDGRLFWTERAGTVKVWQNGSAHTFATVKTVTTQSDGSYSERGLLGLAISPTFNTDRFVYAFYSDVNYTEEHIIRWHDCRGTGTDPTILLTLPSGPDCCHKGGRLAFGIDGMLYVTLGDEHSASAAQDTGDVRGKILRYSPDGSVPSDNPFGATNPVWAYGFRNPFGIAVSSSGQIAVTSNGPTSDAGSPPTGYDTLVLNVQRGKGYQWPDCYGYSHPLAVSSCPADQSPPDYSTESHTLVPTGVAFIDPSGPSQFAGHLVFCTLNGGMRIVTPGNPHASVQPGPSGCLLDVKEGPNHAVYFSDTGTIYRVS
ncbi:MAG TPA: PQQ-dependent sugar dehydrogenase [Ktedonobacteraceae bacterium]|nr:PQQ-dependent sugar dehydrogenase [Ktedonobacteraceae bacterium]